MAKLQHLRESLDRYDIWLKKFKQTSPDLHSANPANIRGLTLCKRTPCTRDDCFFLHPSQGKFRYDSSNLIENNYEYTCRGEGEGGRGNGCGWTSTKPNLCVQCSEEPRILRTKKPAEPSRGPDVGDGIWHILGSEEINVSVPNVLSKSAVTNPSKINNSNLPPHSSDATWPQT